MTDAAIAAPAPNSTAIVLGGGGIAGIAWELGVLRGLSDAGVRLGEASLVVGTSAGSVVGALLRQGMLDEAFAQQLEPVPTSYEEPTSLDPDAISAAVTQALEGATSPLDARTRIGLAAQGVTIGQSDDERVATFAETFRTESWPALPLATTAVDATDGSFRLFTAADGVPLPRAVAASCSVPFVWSPVGIEGRPYVDGGVRSGTNADAVSGFDRVLVLACSPEGPSPTGPFLDEAVAGLRASGSTVEVIIADEASQRAYGTNTLALAAREPSARAGLAQAALEAERVLALFS